jgi:hypothetical protein
MTATGLILWSNYFCVAFFCIVKRWGVEEEGKYRYSDSILGDFFTFKVMAIFCIYFYNGFYT